MIYLETNAIRKLASRLEDSNFIFDKYTSILTLIELVTGITDDNSFLLRQSIIKKVINSKIVIDPRLPEFIRHNAFGAKLNNDVIKDNIYRIVNIITDTKDYDSMNKTIKLSFLEEEWTIIKQYDENADIEFKKSMLKRISDSETKQLIAYFNYRWNFEDLDEIKTKLVLHFTNTTPMNHHKSKSELISLYDNSIDIFLFATAFYVDEKLSYKNTPGKNDYIDLNHLLYLYKSQNQIVTDDKLLHKIMNKFYPENILKTNEV